ncbi:MAG TPA: anthranilate phosphoribosyltransferase [Nitrososphaerales archaeon]|nr:anthranilate phosphoribosyltransferase [Nitrososphaerales archaeon]
MTRIQAAIQMILEGKNLPPETISGCLAEIVAGTATPAQVGGFLIALRKKGETAEEIAAFASTLRGYSLMKARPRVKGRMIDTCGTGGDAVKTPNVSTISAFVSAGAGAVVAKHGGRSVTSKSGSADVLEKLGFNLAMDPYRVKDSIEQLGIGFMFAPEFHPAMKQVAPVRKELGVRTVFNLMGPLINPARVDAQLLGLYSPDLVPQIAAVLRMLGLQEAIVVHGLEGVDEISVTGKTLVAYLAEGSVETREYLPRDFGLPEGPLVEGRCPADAEEAAMVALSILNGDADERDGGRLMVLVNSAACLVLAQKANTFPEGFELAASSIESGEAIKKVSQLVAFSGGSMDGAMERYAKQKGRV